MIEAISQYSLSCQIQLAGQQLSLLPERCLYWHETRSLILSDLHLGKVGHFRKAGIPIPGKIHFDDLRKLDIVLERHAVEQVIFIGDLFHSDINLEWQLFEDWLSQYPELRFILVKGNHDILPQRVYSESLLEIHDQCLVMHPFLFCHIPPEPNTDNSGLYALSGHLHPGVRLKGPGRQVEKLPCFFFGEKSGILPAFGRFTGVVCLPVTDKDKVFAVAGTRVVSL